MKPSRVLVALAVMAVGATLAACGSDDEESAEPTASATELAFLKSMIPHHESAVDMAEMAQEEGEHRQVKQLAAAIIEAQEAEISQMERIYERLTGDEIAPDPAAHEQLGLSQEEAGMHEGKMAALEQVREDFDRAFIDAMIPHHQGAIRQARIVLAETNDSELRTLANAIVSAQSREIRDMNSWRKRWYGGVSPAGGVPSDEELPPSEDDGGSMGSMGH